MNGMEERYSKDVLEPMRIAGEVADYRFESIKLRLAGKTFYEPDFFVLRSDGSGEIHEVKGHWEDDARVKIKVAAESYPWFIFKAIRWDRKIGWITEDF